MPNSEKSPEGGKDYSLAAVQRRLCQYIRNPEVSAPPAGLDSRRLNVYRDLVVNNIESLLANVFPVLKSMLDEQWPTLVRRFLSHHQARTPYFTRLADEFYQFLDQQQAGNKVDLWVKEMAHHELLELRLLYRETQESSPSQELRTDAKLVLSPLAELTRYSYPVHLMNAERIPATPPPEPTFILQFRNRENKVVFMQLSELAAHLVTLISEHPGHSAEHWLEVLADKLEKAAPAAELGRFKAFGRELIAQLGAAGILQPA